MHFDCVFLCAVKARDAEVMLDSSGREFDLPAATIQLRDGQGWQHEAVGKKHECFVGFGVIVFYAADLFGIILA